jgi:predicted GNAT family acetyltransferase
MSDQIIDNTAMHRFELPIEGGPPAVAYYRIEDGTVVLTHTEVPQEFSGQGIGSRLAKAVFDLLQVSGARVIAKCPFMAGYAARHNEYAALLVG